MGKKWYDPHYIGNIRKEEFRLLKTRQGMTERDDIDMSFLNDLKVGDTIKLVDLAVHQLPKGNSCYVFKTDEGKEIHPSLIIRSGNGINFHTKDYVAAAEFISDWICSDNGLTLTIAKKYKSTGPNGTIRINFRFKDPEEEEQEKRIEEERKQREAEEKRLEQYRFNIRNKHWRDQKVSFREEDHIYIVDGTPLDSVTTFVKNCFPEFDSEFHAKRKAEALGITKEAVLEMWDKKGRESREQGTAMHKKIESYYLGKEPSTDDTFDLFKIFADKITLKPYRTEWAVYDWEQKIAGTIDFVDYQNGEYIIYDWKRSDKLIAKNGLPIKNSLYGEKALPPIENLDDSPYYHYALQLSLYKYILEKNYGITVSKLRLGIFHPSYNKPYVLEMPYLQNEIETLFSMRSEVVF